MKLSICITHYDEPTSMVRELLDSIQIQQNVDFNDIEVIIVNDGGDFNQISKIKRSEYPFKITKVKAEHAGLSATRNKALDKAVGEFVMFCDVDDMFYTITALNLILQITEVKPFDMMVSAFIEEVHTNDNPSKILYYPHTIDYTFVHGKVYRRQFLIDNNIQFDPKVGRHQDSPFARLAVATCDKTRLVQCKTPFYLWRWRDDSICRRDKEYSILNSETSYIDGVDSSVREFLQRDKLKDASYAAAHLTYKIYYLINSASFRDPKNEKYLTATELRFKKFYDEFGHMLDNVPQKDKNILIRKYKEDAVKRYGVVLESITFSDWMKHLEGLTAT